MEREWLIEEFITEKQWEHDLAFMVDTLDRYRGYYQGESSDSPESRQRNRHKNIDVLKKARVHVVTRSYYRPWLPIYLFQAQAKPTELFNSFYYGEVDSLFRSLHTRI